MKKINFLYAFMVLLMLAGCKDEDTLPFVEYDGLGYGAYARLIDGVNGKYDFFDVANSSINFTVEFMDESNGANVESYEWMVRYKDNVNGTESDDVAIASKKKGEFGTSEFGLPSTSFTFNMPDVLSTLGMTEDDINGGDALVFNATITKSDGSTFDAGNTGSNIISSAPFSGLFVFQQPIICPSDLAGVYDVITVSWCGGTVETKTEWVATSKDGIYDVLTPEEDPDFSFGAYDDCYGPGGTRPGGSLQIQDACNKIAPIGASRWGEVYWYNSVTVDGNKLTVDWENDYSPEAGVTTFIRTDGTNWPALTN